MIKKMMLKHEGDFKETDHSANIKIYFKKSKIILELKNHGITNKVYLSDVFSF